MPPTEPLATAPATLPPAADPRLLPPADTTGVPCPPVATLDDSAYSGEPAPRITLREAATVWQTAFLFSADGSPVIHAAVVPPKRGRGRPRKHSC